MDQISRRALLKPVKRVVIKVGSAVLTARDGLNRSVIRSITRDICTLRRKGIEVILVSSGAISSGLKKIGLSKRPDSLSQKQAVAAVGQISLMLAWQEAFSRHRVKVAQILITRDDFSHRTRYLNARNTLFSLLSWRIVPVINENDTVAVDEIKFGDNDNLSAMVTSLTDAQLLIALTNMDGLYDKDPRDHKDANLIRVVSRLNKEILGYAGAMPGNLGTGGMITKLMASQKAALCGVPTIIANGTIPGIVTSLFKGKEEGTLFLPQSAALCSRKRWIAFTKSPKGEIVIDRGAERALITGGKSLLPSGIREVKGNFSLGDSVVLLNEDGVALGVGMVNYHAGDIRKIMGLKTREIESILGFKHDDEVVHRDNLVIENHSEEEIGGCQKPS